MEKTRLTKLLACFALCCMLVTMVCHASETVVSVDASDFFLPDPEMTKQQRLKNTVYLQNLNYAAACDGVLTVINNNDRSVTPVFSGGKFYVPLRFILEYYGVGVSWEQETRDVIMTAGDKVYRLSVDDAVMSYGEKTKQLGNACILDKGTTFVAFEDISKMITCETYYFDKFKSGVIVFGEEWFVERKAENEALSAMEFAVSPFFKMFI